MLKKVLNLLTLNGFEKRQSKGRYKKLGCTSRLQEQLQTLSFKHIYINTAETEMYILCESKEAFTEKEIKEYEREIASFVIMVGNRPLAYNINLVLLCPLNLKKNQLSVNSPISRLIDMERNRYYCRKIFLDTANRNSEEELVTLPFLPVKIELDISHLNYEKTAEKIQKVIPAELHKELIKKESNPNLQQVVKFLEITRLNIEGDNNG